MDPPIPKNFLFDTLLPRVEWLAWLLAIMGVVLAYFSYPRAPIFLFLGFSTLAAVYFLSSFTPSATTSNLPYQPSYQPLVGTEEKSFLVQAVIPVLQGQAMAVTLVGIQFKLLFLPGYNTLLSVGLFILAIIIAIQIYVDNLSRKALLVGALGALMACISADELVQQFYRHDPVLIEKMRYHLHHPKDKAAAEEVRRLQRARPGQ
jgi:hypothetical protein